jgi:hypothetical protein
MSNLGPILEKYYKTSCLCCIHDEFENYSYTNCPFDPTGDKKVFNRMEFQYQYYKRILVLLFWPVGRAWNEISPIIQHRLSVFFYRSGLKKLLRQSKSWLQVLGSFLFQCFFAFFQWFFVWCLFVVCFGKELVLLFT